MEKLQYEKNDLSELYKNCCNERKKLKEENNQLKEYIKKEDKKLVDNIDKLKLERVELNKEIVVLKEQLKKLNS